MSFCPQECLPHTHLHCSQNARSPSPQAARLEHSLENGLWRKDPQMPQCQDCISVPASHNDAQQSTCVCVRGSGKRDIPGTPHPAPQTKGSFQ